MDGRPNRRNIAACLNFSGVVRTGPKKNNAGGKFAVRFLDERLKLRFLLNIYTTRFMKRVPIIGSKSPICT